MAVVIFIPILQSAPFNPCAGVDPGSAPDSWQSPFLAIISCGPAPALGGIGIPILQVWKPAWELELPTSQGSSAGQSRDLTGTLKPEFLPSHQLLVEFLKVREGNRSSPQFPLLPQREPEWSHPPLPGEIHARQVVTKNSRAACQPRGSRRDPRGPFPQRRPVVASGAAGWVHPADVSPHSGSCGVGKPRPTAHRVSEAWALLRPLSVSKPLRILHASLPPTPRGRLTPSH